MNSFSATRGYKVLVPETKQPTMKIKMLKMKMHEASFTVDYSCARALVTTRHPHEVRGKKAQFSSR